MQAGRRNIGEGVAQPEEGEEEEGNTSSDDNEGEEDVSDQDELDSGEEWDDDTAINKHASGGDFNAGHGTSVSDFAQVAQADSDFPPSSVSYLSVADSGYGTQTAFNARSSSTTTLNSGAQSTHPMDDYQLTLPEDQGHNSSANMHVLTADTSFPVESCDFSKSSRYISKTLANYSYCHRQFRFTANDGAFWAGICGHSFPVPRAPRWDPRYCKPYKFAIIHPLSPGLANIACAYIFNRQLHNCPLLGAYKRQWVVARHKSTSFDTTWYK